MVTSTPATLRAVLRPVVEAAGCDLEDVSVLPAGRRRLVRVVVDRDGGVTLDGAAEVSTAVAAALDVADADEPLFGGASYVLEVTSPGVDRPLRALRHWRRNVGRLVRVPVADEGAVTGRVLAVDSADEAATVVLDIDGTKRRVPLADLGPGAVQVEFGRPDGAEPA